MSCPVPGNSNNRYLNFALHVAYMPSSSPLGGGGGGGVDVPLVHTMYNIVYTDAQPKQTLIN